MVNTENSKIYFGGNLKSRKIGETKQAISQRKSEIRKIDKNFKIYNYIEFKSTKNERLMVEAILRVELEKRGYNFYGNDHIEIKGTKKLQFIVDCIYITQNILNSLNIKYELKEGK